MIRKLYIEKDKKRKKVCVCGNADPSSMMRVSRPKLVKSFFSWVPLRKYMCFRCLRITWVWTNGKK